MQVRRVFAALVDEVEANRQVLERDICANYDLVDEMLRDQFDFAAASRRILADYWPALDASGQDRFVETFYDYLVVTYADVLVHINDETLRIDELDRPSAPFRAEVTGMVTFTDENEEPAYIRLLMTAGDDQWRIIDVRADSYSYVRGFRDRFRDRINDTSLAELIASLEQEAAMREVCD